MNWHNEKDDLTQLKSDVRDTKHNPDDIQQSAERELRKRGFSEKEITELRNK